MNFGILTPVYKKLKAILAISVVLIIAFLSIKLVGENSLINLNREPEPLSELFFTNHLILPKQIETGVPYSFDFTVRNFEYKEETYFYETTILNSGSTSVLGKGEFTLAHGESKTIQNDFIFSESFGRAKIVVRLINKDQEINFWVEESS